MRAGLLSGGVVMALLATSALAAPAGQETEHVVGKGETLNGIANRAGVSRDVIIRANGLKAPYPLRIGQKLAIPRDKPGGDSRDTAKKSAPAPVASKSAKDNSADKASQSRPSLTGVDSHVVEPGETLGGIALRAQIPRILIAEANGLAPPYPIRAGQTLVLPRTRHHEIEAGDTGFSIAYTYGVPWDQIAVANGIDPDAPLPAGKSLVIPTLVNPPATGDADAAAPASAPAKAAQSPAPAKAATARFAWPLKGPIRRGFIARDASGNHHDGIDIIAPANTAVRAVAAGKVIFARKEPSEYGNLVVIDHGNGWASAYASLARITVKKGNKVARGERVGLVGDTSVTGKTELHFELRKDGKPVDPKDELPPMP